MKRNAFTLIELLVVVAIIVALLALLLPSMGRAIEITQTAVCASNQRQLQVAWLAYAQANFTSVATESKWMGQVGGNYGWCNPDNIKTGQIFEFTSQQYDVYLCPTFANVYSLNPANAGYTPASGYSINTIFSVRNLFNRPRIEKFSRVTAPASLMVFCDENAWTTPGYSITGINDNAILMGVYSNPANLIDAIGSFHQPPMGDVNDGKANVAFADGHVSLQHISQTKEVCWPIDMRP